MSRPRALIDQDTPLKYQEPLNGQPDRDHPRAAGPVRLRRVRGLGRAEVPPADRNMAATVSTLGWTVDPSSTSTDAIGNIYSLWQMGQAPLNWPAPDGYRDVSGAWVGTGVTLSRWNYFLALAAGRNGADMVQPLLATRAVLSAGPATLGALATALLTRFANGTTVSGVGLGAGRLHER
jgi:hypothetical protein